MRSPLSKCYPKEDDHDGISCGCVDSDVQTNQNTGELCYQESQTRFASFLCVSHLERRVQLNYVTRNAL